MQQQVSIVYNMSIRHMVLIWILICGIHMPGFAAPHIAENTAVLPQGSASMNTLIVGLFEAPPFVIKKGDKWGGLSLELWDDIATLMERQYEYREFANFSAMLKAVQKGEIDIAVSNVSVTSEREEIMDFTHPFYRGGIGILVHQPPPSVLSAVKNLLSWNILKMLGLLLLVLISLGVILWLLEKRTDSEEFSQDPVKGIGQGFWISAVTLTTVGFGEKAPTTLMGRTVALLWMFASLMIISGVTATITTTLTVNSLERQISGLEDLTGKNIGTMEGTTSSAYLNSRDIKYLEQPSIVQGVEALEKNKLDAFVYDAPILKYMVQKKRDTDMVVLPGNLIEENYAFVVKANNPLREVINRHMLKIMNTYEWEAKKDKYFR